MAGVLRRSEPASPDPLRRAIGRAIGVAIVVGAVGASALVWHLQYARPRTDDAALRANVIGIAPHVSGPIVELAVVDNQPVKQGELLFAVDARPYEARLEAAQERTKDKTPAAAQPGDSGCAVAETTAMAAASPNKTSAAITHTGQRRASFPSGASRPLRRPEAPTPTPIRK